MRFYRGINDRLRGGLKQGSRALLIDPRQADLASSRSATIDRDQRGVSERDPPACFNSGTAKQRLQAIKAPRALLARTLCPL